MLKIYLYLIVLTIFLSGCEPPQPDEEKLQSNLESVLEETVIHQYVEDFSYDIRAEDDSEDTDYLVILTANVNDDYLKLSDYDKLDVLNTSGIYIEENTTMSICGKEVFCFFDKFEVKNGENVFTVEWADMFFIRGEMYANGKRVTYSDLEFQKLNAELGTASNGTPKWDIHYYMQLGFNDLTNNGEIYVPEIHDPIVAKIASDHFGISPQEAMEIYEEVEYKKSQ